MIVAQLAGRIGRGARHVVIYLRWLGPVRDGRPPAPFTRLSAVHWASAAGDAFLPIALAGSLFFSISLEAAQGRVALALVLTVAPFAVVGPLLGPLIDRLAGGRRSVVVVSAVGRAIAVYFMAEYVHSLLLFPWALVALICSKGYSVTKAALVPAVVESSSQLVEANSKLAIGSSVVGALAAAPAIAVLKLLGGAAVLRVDIAIYVGVAILALRLEELAPPRVPNPAIVDPGPVREASGRPLPPGSLYLAWIAMASLRCVVGLLAFLVVFSFRRDGAPLIWYGVVGLSNVVGNLGGAAVAPRLRQRFGEWRILAGTTFIVGAVGAVVTQMDFVHRWPAALVFAGVLGLGANAAKLAFDALVQQHVAPADRGRLFARTESTFQLVWVVGALIPVLLSIGLLLGMYVAAALVLVAFATMELGNRRAERAALPRWWPGVPRRCIEVAPRPGAAGSAPPSGGFLPGDAGDPDQSPVRWPRLEPGLDERDPPATWVG
jgi:MFS family permease